MLPPLPHAVVRVQLGPDRLDALYVRYGTVVQTTEAADWTIGCDALTLCRALHRAGADLSIYRVTNPAALA